MSSHASAHAVALALAAAVALAGCPAASPEDVTVTPAPVPSPAPGTQASGGCGVPTATPPSATATPAPPAEPVATPLENDTVNVTALVERHDRTLREHRYRLEAPDLSVQADPEDPSFRIHARTTLVTFRHYVVDGTWYSYTHGPGEREPFGVRSYEEESLPDDMGTSYSITGREWLTEALSLGPHRVVDRMPGGGAVLRADAAKPIGEPAASASVERGSVSSLDSTVRVDARGIVRSVEQRYEVHQAETTRIVNDTFAVTDVGTATVERPAWVCVADRDGYLESS